MNNYFDIPEESQCVLCGTNEAGDAIMIPDIETLSGNICEAKLCHVSCLQQKLFIQKGLIIARMEQK